VGAKRRFGAEMCVASAGMRRRLGGPAMVRDGGVSPQVRFARILCRRRDFVAELEYFWRNDVEKRVLQRDMFVGVECSAHRGRP
jgi:hypothetical protein